MKRVLLSVTVALFAGTACAQVPPPPPPCGPADQMIARLGQMFGERPFVRGTNAAGTEIVLLLSPDSRSWTLLLTQDGMACMIMSGTDMQPAERPPDPGNPS
jgi:hypothetical protein